MCAKMRSAIMIGALTLHMPECLTRTITVTSSKALWPLNCQLTSSDQSQ